MQIVGGAVTNNSRRERLIDIILPWALMWFVLSTIGLMASLVSDVLWSDQLLPNLLKPLVFAKESVIAVWLMLLIAVPTQALLAVTERIKQKRALNHQLVFTSIATLVTLFYLAAWIGHWMLGAFLSIDAFQMLSHDGVQLFQHLLHMKPWYLLILLSGPLIIGSLFSIVSRYLTKLPISIKTVVVQTIFGLFFTVLLASLGAEIYALYNHGKLLSDKTGEHYTLTEYKNIVFKERTGPLSSLKNNLSDYFQKETYANNNGYAITSNRIIMVDDYLKRVNRENMKRFNVIVLLVESLRSDQIAVYPEARDAMPTVAAIAQNSTIYTNAYSQSSHSNYADLAPLSSHYPLRSRNIHFYPENPSYPRVLIYDVLQPLGYETVIFSSQNERWGDMYNYLNTGSLNHFFHADSYSGDLRERKIEKEKKPFDWMIKSARSGKIDDSITVSEAMGWLKKLEPNRPFFMYMNLQNSHAPYVIPNGFKRRFSSNYSNIVEKIKTDNSLETAISLVKNQYSDSLYYVDSQIKRLTDYLQDLGRWNNTIFVISADTATRFDRREAVVGNGGGLDQEVVHVPLIIHIPGKEKSIVSNYVQHIDIPPTILNILGLPPHPAFQGCSLVGNCLGRSRSIYLVAQTPIAHQYAIIRNGWKVLYDKRIKRYRLEYVGSSAPQTNINKNKLFNELSERLRTWIELQLRYYDNTYIHSRYYPPVLDEGV